MLEYPALVRMLSRLRLGAGRLLAVGNSQMLSRLRLEVGHLLAVGNPQMLSRLRLRVGHLLAVGNHLDQRRRSTAAADLSATRRRSWSRLFPYWRKDTYWWGVR